MSRQQVVRVSLMTVTLLGGLVAPVIAIFLSLHTASTGAGSYGYVDDGRLAQLVLVPLTVIMVWRRPDRLITLVYVGLSVFAGMQQFAGAYAVEGLVASPGLLGAVAAQFGQEVFQTWTVVTFLLLLAVFPTGRTVGRGFSWIPMVIPLLYVGLALLFLTSPHPFVDPEFPQPAAIEAIEGPLAGIPDTIANVGSGIVAVLTVAVFLGALVQVIVRFIRSRGVERQQLRWFFYSVIGAALLFVVTPLVARDGAGILNPWSTAPALVVASMALAVLRYRLYDIDRIVSRTVSYTVVVGLLGLVFAAGVVWIPSLFGVGQSPLLVAASTLAVAALFNPVRRRVQRVIDRRFNRARYDAERVVEGFSTSLRDRVESDDLVHGWVDVVSTTMQPSAIGVWVR